MRRLVLCHRVSYTVEESSTKDERQMPVAYEQGRLNKSPLFLWRITHSNNVVGSASQKFVYAYTNHFEEVLHE